MSHDLEQKFLLGGCTLNGNGETHGISPGDAFLLEFVSTFLLLFVGITVAFDKKRRKEVGHALGLLHVVSTNGARSFHFNNNHRDGWLFWRWSQPSKTFPTKGLVVLEGEHDILSIGEACFKGSSTPVYIQKYE
ncbi:unnamed protein product [Prunus armeniaca]|uniref:Uncharacterized protein n=1 Tax=Prunus armeniaca TaxID=36596 RepID=A0A6J5VY68_PRUAR|nr:unnamed protein product [Prunus armeniaca]